MPIKPKKKKLIEKKKFPKNDRYALLHNTGVVQIHRRYTVLLSSDGDFGWRFTLHTIMDGGVEQ